MRRTNDQAGARGSFPSCLDLCSLSGRGIAEAAVLGWMPRAGMWYTAMLSDPKLVSDRRTPMPWLQHYEMRLCSSGRFLADMFGMGSWEELAADTARLDPPSFVSRLLRLSATLPFEDPLGFRGDTLQARTLPRNGAMFDAGRMQAVLFEAVGRRGMAMIHAPLSRMDAGEERFAQTAMGVSGPATDPWTVKEAFAPAIHDRATLMRAAFCVRWVLSGDRRPDGQWGLRPLAEVDSRREGLMRMHDGHPEPFGLMMPCAIIDAPMPLSVKALAGDADGSSAAPDDLQLATAAMLDLYLQLAESPDNVMYRRNDWMPGPWTDLADELFDEGRIFALPEGIPWNDHGGRRRIHGMVRGLVESFRWRDGAWAIGRTAAALSVLSRLPAAAVRAGADLAAGITGWADGAQTMALDRLRAGSDSTVQPVRTKDIGMRCGNDRRPDGFRGEDASAPMVYIDGVALDGYWQMRIVHAVRKAAEDDRRSRLRAADRRPPLTWLMDPMALCAYMAPETPAVEAFVEGAEEDSPRGVFDHGRIIMSDGRTAGFDPRGFAAEGASRGRINDSIEAALAAGQEDGDE